MQRFISSDQINKIEVELVEDLEHLQHAHGPQDRARGNLCAPETKIFHSHHHKSAVFTEAAITETIKKVKFLVCNSPQSTTRKEILQELIRTNSKAKAIRLLLVHKLTSKPTRESPLSEDPQNLQGTKGSRISINKNPFEDYSKETSLYKVAKFLSYLEIVLDFNYNSTEKTL